MSDSDLELVLNTNPVFRYNLNLIKYLNLAHNKLVRLSSSSNTTTIGNSEELLDELKLLNNNNNNQNERPILRANHTGYLLNRFFNVESLFLDDNPSLVVSVGDLTSVLPQLKVLSVSRCGHAGESQISTGVPARSMIYLGLSGNRITDHSLVDYLPQHFTQIDILDLSFNKLSNLSSVLGRLERVGRLNLEKNRIETFRVDDLVAKSIGEVNLRANFIQNTSVENFRTREAASNRPVWLRLAGNPLICDCHSIWLLDLVREQLSQQQITTGRSVLNNNNQLLSRKRPKSTSSDVRIVSRRDMEVISYHNIDQDPNFSTSMQRQKRLNETTPTSLHGLAAKFLDLDQLTCSFIDAQDTGSTVKRSQSLPHRPVSINSTDLDASLSVDYFLVDSVGKCRRKLPLINNF